VLGALVNYFAQFENGLPETFWRDFGIIFVAFQVAGISAQRLVRAGAVRTYIDHDTGHDDTRRESPIITQPQMLQEDVRALWQSRMQNL